MTEFNLTRQEIFNTVWDGLKSQNFERSLIEKGCAYRGRNGMKCAAGWMIPDELYDPEYEGQTIDTIDALYTYFGKRSPFIHQLQEIHDDNETNDSMEKKLRYFAEVNDLTIPNE